MDEAIVNRALRFASTHKFVNPRVTCASAAPQDIVDKHGTPDAHEYGEVRIVMDWPQSDIDSILADLGDNNPAEIKALFDAGMELRVVCSKTDIVYSEFVGVDFD